MERYIFKCSYWLGVLALGLALLTRFVDIFAPEMNLIVTKGDPIGYRAFMHGAFLFFATTMASASYIWFKTQGTQSSRNAKSQDRGLDEIVKELVDGNTEHSGRVATRD